MTVRFNNQNEQSGLVPLSILEKMVNKLLVHREHNSLRVGFIELIQDWHKPKQIQLFVEGQRGIMMHREQPLANVKVHDILATDARKIHLSDSQFLYTAVESQDIQIITDSQSSLVDLYVPVMQGEVVSAVIVIKGISFEPDNKQIWEQMLSAYKHMHRILYLGEVDPLTGLMNRLAFDRLLNQVEADNGTSSTDEEANYFVLVDIDFFKKINDEFGHLYGDEVLILLARSMSESFRSIDWVFRYGGEEFAIVLHAVSRENAHQALERFRATIENTVFPQVGTVTVSIGFSRMDTLEATSSVIDRADNALYYAKNHGRNQVFNYNDLLAQGLLKPALLEVGDVELF